MHQKEVNALNAFEGSIAQGDALIVMACKVSHFAFC
jgi:hypothetical protein